MSGRERIDLRQWRTIGVQLIETPLFTRQVRALLTDEEYRSLQLSVAEHPETGDVIPGTGGIRKLRWRRLGRGKRGGVRVFYRHHEATGRIYLLHLIAKTQREDLTLIELRELGAAMKEELP